MDIKMTKDDVCHILMQAIIQDSLDKEIRNRILDKFEDEPYYEMLADIASDLGHAYFKLGFEVCNLIAN